MKCARFFFALWNKSHIFAVPILKIGVALYPCILLLERQGYSTKIQKFYYSSTKN
nr:MAG TPA: hypothetical protein [Caudoviricetes sp.]